MHWIVNIPILIVDSSNKWREYIRIAALSPYKNIEKSIDMIVACLMIWIEDM